MRVFSDIHIAKALWRKLIFEVPGDRLHLVYEKGFAVWDGGDAILNLLEKLIPLWVSDLELGLMTAFSSLSKLKRGLYRILNMSICHLRLLCWDCNAAFGDKDHFFFESLLLVRHFDLVDRDPKRRLARTCPALVCYVKKGNFIVAGFVHFRLDYFVIA